jgi:hypothetical protein
MKLVASILSLAALTLAACGSSTPSREEAATNDLCAARADISSQVATLQGTVAAPGTPKAVAAAMTAIKNDVNKMREARGQLAPQSAAQISAATDAFSSRVQSVAM